LFLETSCKVYIKIKLIKFKFMIYFKTKKIKLFFVVLSFFLSQKVLSQNDCVDAILICGNANLSGLTATGIGIQEITPDNACSSGENNSLWLKIKINTGGTLGFVLTPQSTDILEDLDFWIFGPNVSCSNRGTAIRCSTTNPFAINQPDNLTGMNSTETDVSEGPGFDGNSFVKWMDVLDNETYYIAIDRPQGVSAFSIAWTGTATFYQPPVPIATNDFQKCSLPNLPGKAIFDLTPNINLSIGNQTNVVATFFTSYNDAVTNTNPILNPNAYQNLVNPQQIYIRLLNIYTGCFAISNFGLSVALTAITGFSYSTPVCINDVNPSVITSPGFTNGGIFTSTSGLSINSTNGNINLTSSIPGNYVVTYTIIGNPSNCQNMASSTFMITINPLPSITPNTTQQSLCINTAINTISYNIGGFATGASITTGSLPLGLTGTYNNGVFTINGIPLLSGSFNYTLTTTGGCSPDASFNGIIIINSLPIVTLPQDGYICVDDVGNPTGTFLLSTNISTATNSFVWSNSSGIITGQSGSNYTVTTPGNYSVITTNINTGCKSERATTTIASFFPPLNVIATKTNYFTDIQTIRITVLPEGIYEYKLDNNLFQENNEFTNLSMGTHEVFVIDKFGCGLKKIVVQIINYPNYFTPNGDSYHDLWNINELKNQLNSYINIFDRYGKLIKQIKPSGPGWDGNYNGNPLPASDYWFTVYYVEQNKNEQFSSHFSLLR
jgi:gliding motility-associated-like protein